MTPIGREICLDVLDVGVQILGQEIAEHGDELNLVAENLLNKCERLREAIENADPPGN